MTPKAEFLVQLDGQNFYIRTDDQGQVFGEPYPSAAEHLSYDQADNICQQLRQQGYPAVVTDIYGQPISGEQLSDMRPSSIWLEREELYFVRRDGGKLVGTRSAANAFRGPRALIELIAEDLQSAGCTVCIVKNPDDDLRRNPLYIRTMLSN